MKDLNKTSELAAATKQELQKQASSSILLLLLLLLLLLAILIIIKSTQGRVVKNPLRDLVLLISLGGFASMIGCNNASLSTGRSQT
jgi:glucan phosphoethanolaminetransferase (alkaline phosphatase superfamily)